MQVLETHGGVGQHGQKGAGLDVEDGPVAEDTEFARALDEKYCKMFMARMMCPGLAVMASNGQVLRHGGN